MQLIDTHTHLYADQFEDDREQMIEKSIEKGISKFFLPNIDSSSIDGMKDLVKKFPNHCFPLMGLHPCSVGENVQEELDRVKMELESHKYYGVGEIGMDLYWDKSFQEAQEMAFRTQIEWAKAKGLPIVIHCREAFDEIFAVIDDMNDERLFGIFHCFTGNVEQANHILQYGGFKLGIGGVVTFKNAGLDKTIAKLSIEDLVLETDSPYLAPVPFRGKRNESSYLDRIAEKVAEVFEIPLTEVAKTTTATALKIFQNEG